MKVWKRVLGILLAAVLIVGGIGAGNGIVDTNKASAARKKENKNISIGAFVKKLEKAVGLKTGTLIMKDEFPDMKEKITWTQAAVLANRADEAKNGTDYNENLYKEVVDGKRLTGLTGLGTEEKKAVRLCFVKGIISGDSKGQYSQSRAFRAGDKITTKEAHKILVRLENEKKRIKLSPDGQVIRTTNLPKNHKKFDYILASFPNEFYERKFYYEMFTYYYEPVNLEDYACPRDMKKKITKSPYVSSGTFAEMYEKYAKDWVKTIEANLTCRFNFDYRTVDDKWINHLASTYIYDDDTEWNGKVTDAIKDYVETAKKNHIVVKADKIVVEPSTLYYDGAEYYVRCYIRFKINADIIYTAKKGETNRQHELIFSGSNSVYLENLKKNKWYEMSMDVPVRQTIGNQNPVTYSIGTDQIWPWE